MKQLNEYDQFSGPACKELRKDLTSLLEVLEDQHGIKIAIGSMTYDGQSAWFKTTVVLPDSDGTAHSPNELAYIKESKRELSKVIHGFENWKKLGDTFTQGMETYTICGWKPKSRKYPLLGKKANGRTYKFPAKYADADK